MRRATNAGNLALAGFLLAAGCVADAQQSEHGAVVTAGVTGDAAPAAAAPRPADVMQEFRDFYSSQLVFFNHTRGFMCACGYASDGVSIDEESCRRAICFTDAQRTELGACIARGAPELTDELAAELASHLRCVETSLETALQCVATVEERHGGLCTADDVQSVKRELGACGEGYSSGTMACQRPMSTELTRWFETTSRANRAGCLTAPLVTFPRPAALQR